MGAPHSPRHGESPSAHAPRRGEAGLGGEPDRRHRGGWFASMLAFADVLAVAGCGVATYLTVVHYADQPIVCSGIGDCELVNSSRYATIAGVPVALLGASAYVAIFVLITTAWLRRSEAALTAAWGIALASFAFSMYLTYVEVRVLDAICIWCVASACVVTAMAVVLSASVWIAGPERT